MAHGVYRHGDLTIADHVKRKEFKFRRIYSDLHIIENWQQTI